MTGFALILEWLATLVPAAVYIAAGIGVVKTVDSMTAFFERRRKRHGEGIHKQGAR